MQIIENNHLTLKVECIYCKSILRLNPTDIKGGDVTSFYFRCIACGLKNDLQQKTIPIHILREI